MYCLGYITGAGHVAQRVQGVAQDVFDPACNPEALHYTAHSILLAALAKAFPCKKAPPTTGSVGKY